MLSAIGGILRVNTQPLRIGGGVFNGRRLHSVPGSLVRPTSGRVRQALFNMLRPVMRDAIFVDLFAGAGCVGLEALSHGAAQAYFVEQDRRVAATLRRNIEACAVSDRAVLIAAPLPQAVHRLPAALQADILFLDPPYASDLAEQTLAALESQPRIGAKGDGGVATRGAASSSRGDLGRSVSTDATAAIRRYAGVDFRFG